MKTFKVYYRDKYKLSVKFEFGPNAETVQKAMIKQGIPVIKVVEWRPLKSSQK